MSSIPSTTSSNPITSMENLPNELVRMLFECMSLKQRGGIARVCKVWAYLENTFSEKQSYLLLQTIWREADIFYSKPTKYALEAIKLIHGNKNGNFFRYQTRFQILKEKNGSTYKLTKYVKNWTNDKKYWEEFEYQSLKVVTEFVFKKEEKSNKKIEYIMPTASSDLKSYDTIGALTFGKNNLKDKTYFRVFKSKGLDINDERVIKIFYHCLVELRKCWHPKTSFPLNVKTLTLKVHKYPFEVYINNMHNKFTFQSLLSDLSRFYNYKKTKITIDNTTWIETDNKKELIKIIDNQNYIVSEKQFRKELGKYTHLKVLDMVVENAESSKSSCSIL